MRVRSGWAWVCLATACQGDDADRADQTPTTTETGSGTTPTADRAATVTLAAYGDPVPLTWVLTVDADAPVTVSATFQDPDGHRVALPERAEALAAHDRFVKGFRPGRTYSGEVVLTWDDGHVQRYPQAFETAALPATFPTIVKHTVIPERTEPGVTVVLVRPGLVGTTTDNDFFIALDAEGEVVWWFQPSDPSLFMQTMPDGTLASVASDPEGDGGPINLYDRQGVYQNRWLPKYETGYGIACEATGFHHELIQNPLDGSYVTLMKVPTPSMTPISYDDPTPQPTNLSGDWLFAFDPLSPTCEPVYQLDLISLLDAGRIGYGSLDRSHFDQLFDWGHSNAVWIDPTDGGYVVSFRNQDAIVKFRDGQVAWILGNHDNWKAELQPLLLTPLGDLAWQYHQHSPQLHPSDPTRMLVMDNGDVRSSPFTGVPIPDPSERYSRLVEFTVDEVNRTVAQTWVLDTLDGERFFAPFVGDADYLPTTDHVLGCLGYLVSIGDQDNPERGYGGRTVRLVEAAYADPTDVVWDVELVDTNLNKPGWTAYRAERLPSLYAPGE